MQILETTSFSSIQILLDSLHSPYTRRVYLNGLKMFVQFHKIEDYDSLLEIDKRTTSNMIRRFIMYQRNARQLSLGRINVCFSALKFFYEMNDYEGLNWSKLARYKGRDRQKMVNDRTYTKEEIQKMLQFADLRMKVIILTMLSSGVRTGGLAGLRIKDLTYLEEYKLYRIVVYSDSPSDTYYTFCTPECAQTIRMYLDSRQNQFGEILTPDSPLIRQKFDCVTNIEMTSEDIQERMRQLLIQIGMSPPKTRMRDHPDQPPLTKEELVERKRKRHPVMRCHGLRKYFNTVCIESDMKNVPKELMMGHKQNLGMDRHYYRPTSDKLLNEYIKVIDNLTINEENRLLLENTTLKRKQKAQELRLSSLEDKFDSWVQKSSSSDTTKS